MKIIYLLLLFAFVKQNDASKKGGKGNRTANVVKKIVPILALLYSQAEPQNNNSALCPSLPERTGVELMNYVRCYQSQEPEFGKYLMNVDECENVNSLYVRTWKYYQNSKEFGKCVLDVPKVILQGVKSRLFASVTEPDNLEMLNAHLKSLGQINNRDLERLLNKAERIGELNFFQVKQAADFLQKHEGFGIETSFEEALKPDYQDLDFDKAEQLIEITSELHDHRFDAVTKALRPEYQSLDVNKVGYLSEITKQMHDYKFDAIKEALRPEYKSLDVNKVKELIEITRKLHANEFDVINEALKPECQI
jgi:hypothetical protein